LLRNLDADAGRAGGMLAPRPATKRNFQRKADGVQLLFTSVGPTTITVTNPANGKGLTGMGQTAGKILKISDSSFVDHLNGILLNFVLPGEGGVSR
jgi:hypothetical protein